MPLCLCVKIAPTVIRHSSFVTRHSSFVISSSASVSERRLRWSAVQISPHRSCTHPLPPFTPISQRERRARRTGACNMALTIAPTPFLTGRDASRFDRLVAEGLKHTLKPKNIEIDWDEIHRIQDEIIAKRKAATTRKIRGIRIEVARPAGRGTGRVLTQRHRAAEAQRPGRADVARARAPLPHRGWMVALDRTRSHSIAIDCCRKQQFRSGGIRLWTFDLGPWQPPNHSLRICASVLKSPPPSSVILHSSFVIRHSSFSTAA